MAKKKEKLRPTKYNDDLTHEALHATDMISSLFDDYVCNAACSHEFDDVFKLADKISEKLGDLYQLIGSKLSRHVLTHSSTQKIIHNG